jgi:hypothetical protein
MNLSWPAREGVESPFMSFGVIFTAPENHDSGSRLDHKLLHEVLPYSKWD